jgi:hypothetical protein
MKKTIIDKRGETIMRLSCGFLALAAIVWLIFAPMPVLLGDWDDITGSMAFPILFVLVIRLYGKARGPLVLACSALLLFAEVSYYGHSTFYKIDSCLDRGGCWNYKQGECETDSQDKCE